MDGSQVALHISLENFLPVIGIAWTTKASSQDGILFTTAIYDNRRCSLLYEFVHRWPNTTIFYCSIAKSNFLKALISPILNSVSPENGVVEFLDPNLLLGPSTIHAAYLYPIPSQLATQLWFSVAHGDVKKPARLAYVSCVSEVYTSVTEANLISLAVLNPSRDVGGGADFSLFTFFARQITMMGKRHFKSTFLRHPLVCCARISERMKLIQLFLKDRMMASLVSQRLSKLPDMDKMLMRFVTTAGGKAASANTPSAIDYLSSSQRRRLLPLVISLYEALIAIRQLVSLLGDSASDLLKSMVVECQPLISLIHKVYNIEEVKSEGPRIIQQQISEASTDAAMAGLSDVYKQLDHIQNDISTEFNRVNDQVGDKAKIVNQSPHGQIFRVPKTVADLPKQSVLIRVNKNEKLFTTPQMQELNYLLNDASQRASESEDYLIRKTLHVVVTYVEPLQSIIDEIAVIDILNGIATTFSLASGGLWNCPELSVDGGIQIHEGRHPLLALRCDLGACSSEVCIANDFSAHQGKQHFVITGPNMGGKSTYSRQQALSVLMTQYGMLLPCRDAIITPFHIFWARIGANDNPCRNSSTFMVEAHETAEMINAIECSQSALAECDKLRNSSNHNALVILDELGRGTSITDGLKFARCIEQYLVGQKNAVSLCATHFHELASVEGTIPLRLGRCRTQEQYRVVMGVEKDSDGILTAERCGFPSEITDRAKRLVDLIHL